MDIEKLKQKILDLAIRGKLVPQDPNDEPASVLVEKIRKEKEELIKQGKIKRDKNESYIYKGSDNCYYEKFNELPFNWQLVKFGEIVNIRRGASPRPIKDHLTDAEDGINWIKIGDTKPGDIYINQTQQKIKKTSVTKSVFLEKGTLVLSNSMSFGRPYILNIDGCIHDGWLSIKPYGNTISIEFLQIILQGYMWYFKNKATGTGVDNLNIDRVYEMPFALPPIKEQERILKKLIIIDDNLKALQNNIDKLSILIEQTKYKILDYYFGEDSCYKSYYKKVPLYSVCKLEKKDISNNGLLPYLEAKVIRGTKNPIFKKEGMFIAKGTLIILVDGENSGEVMVVPFNGYMGSTFRILHFNNDVINQDYLSFFILYNKQNLKDNKTGSAIPHLNKKIFNSLSLILPDINKQKSIVHKISLIFDILDKLI